MSDFAKNANANCGMWAPLDRYNFTRLESFIKSGMGESSTTPLMEGLRQELFYEEAAYHRNVLHEDDDDICY